MSNVPRKAASWGKLKESLGESFTPGYCILANWRLPFEVASRKRQFGMASGCKINMTHALRFPRFPRFPYFPPTTFSDEKLRQIGRKSWRKAKCICGKWHRLHTSSHSSWRLRLHACHACGKCIPGKMINFRGVKRMGRAGGMGMKSILQKCRNMRN